MKRLLAAVALLVLPTTAQAEPSWKWSDPGEISSGDWQFGLNAYLWIPKAPATFTGSGGAQVELPETTANIFESLQFASMLFGDVHKGPLGFFVSPFMGNLDFSESGTIRFPNGPDLPARLKISEDLLLMDFGASYDIGTLHLGDRPGELALTIAPFVGGSFFTDNIRISVTEIPLLPDFRESGVIDFLIPIVGGDLRFQIDESWHARLIGHYGGFGADQVNKKWELFGAIGYEFEAWGQDMNAFAGYRHTVIDLETETGTIDIDVTVKGPVLGFGIKF